MSDTVKLIIEMPKAEYERLVYIDHLKLRGYIENGTPLTSQVLADALMEERIRGILDSDTTFEKDIIHDVKCRLTVSIIDHRPCYCGSELKEVWRKSEE